MQRRLADTNSRIARLSTQPPTLHTRARTVRRVLRSSRAYRVQYLYSYSPIRLFRVHVDAFTHTPTPYWSVLAPPRPVSSASVPSTALYFPRCMSGFARRGVVGPPCGLDLRTFLLLRGWHTVRSLPRVRFALWPGSAGIVLVNANLERIPGIRKASLLPICVVACALGVSHSSSVS